MAQTSSILDLKTYEAYVWCLFKQANECTLDWSISEDANETTPESASSANPARGMPSSSSEYKPHTY